jgi:hypothetical protein
MKTTKQIALFAAILLTASTAANAGPYAFTYTDTVSNGPGGYVPGASVGDTVTITLVLDNGNNSLINQTWTYSNLVSINFKVNSWSATIDYTSGKETFSGAQSGTFTTNGSGTLTSVMTYWSDNTISASNCTFSGGYNPSAPYWYLNGENGVYGSNSDMIFAANVANDLIASNWNVSAAVPEAGDFGLMAGVGVLGLVFLRRRKKA